MGGGSSVFSASQLEEYQDCTFFTKKEILHIHKRFRMMATGDNYNQDTRLPLETILTLPELKVSYRVRRHCHVADMGR